MEQSEEVRSALSSLVETFGTPRMAAAFADAISTEPGTLGVGTDPGEWWDDADSLLRALRQQSAELQGAAATLSHSEGWVEGDVGWGAVKADIAFPGAPTVPMRITATLARRPGGWKIVQFHASIGAANEDIVGKQLTI
jgi:SnoaL-like domain